jgi:hypothetical protein
VTAGKGVVTAQRETIISDTDNGWIGTELLNVLQVQSENRYVTNLLYFK